MSCPEMLLLITQIHINPQGLGAVADVRVFVIGQQSQALL